MWTHHTLGGNWCRWLNAQEFEPWSRERTVCDACWFVSGTEDPWIKELLTKSTTCLLNEAGKTEKGLWDQLSMRKNKNLNALVPRPEIHTKSEVQGCEVPSWT